MGVFLQGAYTGWPYSGEMDIMEWVHEVGKQRRYLGSLHWAGATDWSAVFKSQTSPTDLQVSIFLHSGYGLKWENLQSKWNTYGVEYSAVPGNEYVQFYFIPGGRGKKCWGPVSA